MLITQPDHERLTSLMKTRASADASRSALVGTLRSASIVPSAAVPSDVVTMNTIVRLIDMTTGGIFTFALVYPVDANVDKLRISVLAPLGTALLGRAVGDVIEVAVPGGTKQYYVDKVLYQPEAGLRSGSRSELDGLPAA
jgi:regulator of nucleoside diphosphate kinase